MPARFSVRNTYGDSGTGPRPSQNTVVKKESQETNEKMTLSTAKSNSLEVVVGI